MTEALPKPISIPREVAYEALGCLIRSVDRSKINFNNVIGKVVDETQEAICSNRLSYEGALIISELLGLPDVGVKKLKPAQYIMHDLHALAKIIPLPSAAQNEQYEIFDYLRDVIVSAKTVPPILCASSRTGAEITALQETDRNTQEGIRFHLCVSLARRSREDFQREADFLLRSTSPSAPHNPVKPPQTS